jgi:hypothetical protein
VITSKSSIVYTAIGLLHAPVSELLLL